MTRPPVARIRRRSLAALALGGIALGAASCSNEDPLAKDDSKTEKGGSGKADAGTLVVGSQQYYSNEIIAELFAQAIEANGAKVKREYQIGQREVYMPELKSGKIDVFPEYVGNLLQYVDKDAAGADASTMADKLGDALPDGLRVLDLAEATDQDTYTTTSDFAKKHSLKSLADLAGVKELKVAANSEFDARPYGPKGLKKLYDATVSVVPVEDSGGPLTVKALLDGDVQLADIYSADPAIEKNDLVVLEDPENLILPENVIPVVSEKVDDDVAKAINAVSAKLDVDALRELNARSVDEKASSGKIAKKWLADQGLV